MPQIPEFAMYYASKHAVTVLTEGLRKELQILKSKIRITVIYNIFLKKYIISLFLKEKEKSTRIDSF